MEVQPRLFLYWASQGPGSPGGPGPGTGKRGKRIQSDGMSLVLQVYSAEFTGHLQSSFHFL